MKVTAKTKKDFQPITLEITFETEKEAEEFKCIFQHKNIISVVPNLDHNAITEALGEIPFGDIWDDFVAALRRNFSE